MLKSKTHEGYRQLLFLIICQTHLYNFSEFMGIKLVSINFFSGKFSNRI